MEGKGREGKVRRVCAVRLWEWDSPACVASLLLSPPSVLDQARGVPASGDRAGFGVRRRRRGELREGR
jgi:hypothetical protein